ncbi:MAG: hypothetical protein JHC33_10975 [Ignisphaera sp.]|nr:hypothetical protein [Ignisphaera sp.]
MLNFISEMTSVSKNFEVFEEKANPSSSWKSLKVRGVFQRANVKNQNGRIYPYKVLDHALQEINEQLVARSVMGELDHPADQSPTVSLKNVSHVITTLRFSGNDLIGEAVVFDDPGPSGTPSGRLLGALIRNNCTVGISSRGYGAVKSDYDGSSIVEEYKLCTFDMVQDPSTHKAFIEPVNEGTDFKRKLQQALEEKEFMNHLRNEFSSLFKKN